MTTRVSFTIGALVGANVVAAVVATVFYVVSCERIVEWIRVTF